MYVYQIKFCNAAKNGTGVLSLRRDKKGLKKWQILNSPDAGSDSELLKLLALACSGCVEYVNHLPCDLQKLLKEQKQSLQLELIWVEHMARKGIVVSPRKQSGLLITPQGRGKRLLKKDIGHPLQVAYSSFSKWSPPAKHPVFAYGTSLTSHKGSDDFDFGDPFYQLRRIHSLFSHKALLTDPLAFLNNLHYRAVLHKRYMPDQILQSLQHALHDHLDLDTSRWMDKDFDFSRYWKNLPAEHQLLLLPLLDAARHLHDALPSHPNPLHFPGIMLLDRPDVYCPPDLFATWLSLLDQLFPAMQFIISLSGIRPEQVPGEKLVQKSLQFQESTKPPPCDQDPSKKHTALPAKAIVLIDVDGRLPNLALMKLGRYYKQKGHDIWLMKKEAYEAKAEAVFASSVFPFPASQKRVQQLRAFYGDALHCGGSGIDIHKRLPPEIEETEPDYELYPDLGDRSIGFLTRGCPFHCSFCIVPIKEGNSRQVSDIEALTMGGRKKKLILLDDNILAHPKSNELLKEMITKTLRVNFNQTLDLSLVDKEKARLIRAIPCSNVKFTRTVYHFSLNDTRNLEDLRKKYELFDFGAKENVEFICMYGYNTTLAQDLERFRFLRSLPGAYVFVQEYQPISGGPTPQLDHFFDGQADRYIDELTRICFPQSMKSMENYFRWLSKLYAKRFGTLHMGLVDTIFRYNKRYKRGRYIATLAGTKGFVT